jgi:hypothetical protein
MIAWFVALYLAVGAYYALDMLKHVPKDECPMDFITSIFFAGGVMLLWPLVPLGRVAVAIGERIIR